jgi:hypothetical protein
VDVQPSTTEGTMLLCLCFDGWASHIHISYMTWEEIFSRT